jgi:hypothetical protein
MELKIASGAVRLRKGDYNLAKISQETVEYGKYALLTKAGISFYSEPAYGIQEYLVSHYKIKNGLLVVQVNERVFEVSFVKSSFIENFDKIILDKNDDSIDSIAKRVESKVRDFYEKNDGCKVVISAKNLSFKNSLVNFLNDLQNVVTDQTTNYPEKFNYRLAITLNKSESSTKIAITVTALFALFIGWVVWSNVKDDEEVIQATEEIANPYANYYATLYGDLPSVRQQLWLAYEMLSNIQTLPDRKLQTLTFGQRPERRSMVISAEIVSAQDEGKSDLTSLIQRVNQFEGGYMLDIQQQYPIVFREVPNIGAYDQANEDGSYDPETNKESNVGIYNIDKTIAYLRDAVNGIVPNVRVIIPPSSESARVSNGSFQQREINISFEGNYKEDLDYLSIIFAGWPVVFVSGRLTGVDTSGRFTGQISLTILGDTL